MYRQQEEWDKGLPSTLIPPIKYLRDAFEDAHWTYGQVSEKHCYHRLHPEEPGDITEYLRPLEQLKRRVRLAASQRFLALLNAGTAPVVFKAFFDFYLEGVTFSAAFPCCQNGISAATISPRLGRVPDIGRSHRTS
jgi:hypothetical protein